MPWFLSGSLPALVAVRPLMLLLRRGLGLMLLLQRGLGTHPNKHRRFGAPRARAGARAATARANRASLGKLVHSRAAFYIHEAASLARDA